MLIEKFLSLNFEYTNLTLENLDLTNYINWLQDPEVQEFIESARGENSLQSITDYIHEKNLSKQALLLGVFSKVGHAHIGNIKFEPIDLKEKTAWLGVLIGERIYRGQGHSFEIINETTLKVSMIFGIKKFFLGVDPRNKRAHSAYRKLGFIECGKHEKGGIIMEKNVSVISSNSK